MKVPPPGISDEAWADAVRAGFHATEDASRREVEKILAAAVPVLGLVPTRPDPAERVAS